MSTISQASNSDEVPYDVLLKVPSHGIHSPWNLHSFKGLTALIPGKCAMCQKRIYPFTSSAACVRCSCYVHRSCVLLDYVICDKFLRGPTKTRSKGSNRRSSRSNHEAWGVTGEVVARNTKSFGSKTSSKKGRKVQVAQSVVTPVAPQILEPIIGLATNDPDDNLDVSTIPTPAPGSKDCIWRSTLRSLAKKFNLTRTISIPSDAKILETFITSLISDTTSFPGLVCQTLRSIYLELKFEDDHTDLTHARECLDNISCAVLTVLPADIAQDKDKLMIIVNTVDRKVLSTRDNAMYEKVWNAAHRLEYEADKKLRKKMLEIWVNEYLQPNNTNHNNHNNNNNTNRSTPREQQEGTNIGNENVNISGEEMNSIGMSSPVLDQSSWVNVETQQQPLEESIVSSLSAIGNALTAMDKLQHLVAALRAVARIVADDTPQGVAKPHSLYRSVDGSVHTVHSEASACGHSHSPTHSHVQGVKERHLEVASGSHANSSENVDPNLSTPNKNNNDPSNDNTYTIYPHPTISSSSLTDRLTGAHKAPGGVHTASPTDWQEVHSIEEEMNVLQDMNVDADTLMQRFTSILVRYEFEEVGDAYDDYVFDGLHDDDQRSKYGSPHIIELPNDFNFHDLGTVAGSPQNSFSTLIHTPNHRVDNSDRTSSGKEAAMLREDASISSIAPSSANASSKETPHHRVRRRRRKRLYWHAECNFIASLCRENDWLLGAEGYAMVTLQQALISLCPNTDRHMPTTSSHSNDASDPEKFGVKRASESSLNHSLSREHEVNQKQEGQTASNSHENEAEQRNALDENRGLVPSPDDSSTELKHRNDLEKISHEASLQNNSHLMQIQKGHETLMDRSAHAAASRQEAGPQGKAREKERPLLLSPPLVQRRAHPLLPAEANPNSNPSASHSFDHKIHVPADSE